MTTTVWWLAAVLVLAGCGWVPSGPSVDVRCPETRTGDTVVVVDCGDNK